MLPQQFTVCVAHLKSIPHTAVVRAVFISKKKKNPAGVHKVLLDKDSRDQPSEEVPLRF